MGGDGVSDVSAGAGEGVGGMVNGTGLTSRSMARSGAVGAEIHINNELADVRDFRKVTEGGLVRKSWVDGSEERIWKPSLRICLRW